MASNTASFLADQLRKQYAGQWNISGVDRATELANMLASKGVTDISQMKLKNDIARDTIDAGTGINTGGDAGEYISPTYHTTNDGSALDFGNGVLIGNMGDRGKGSGGNDNIFGEGDKGNEIGWSSEGHGNVGYVVDKDAKGNPIIRPQWGSSSDAEDARNVAKGLALVAGAYYLAPAMAGAEVGAGAAGGSVAGSVGEGAVFNAAADSQLASSALGISGADAAGAASVPSWASGGATSFGGGGTGMGYDFGLGDSGSSFGLGDGGGTNAFGDTFGNTPISSNPYNVATPDWSVPSGAPAGSWVDKAGNLLNSIGQVIGKGRPTPGGSGQTVAGIDQAINKIDSYGKQSQGILQPYEGDPGQQRNTVSNYLAAGTDGLNYLRAQTGPLNVKEFYDPSMAFQMEQGQKAIDRSAASRGGLLSGAALKDALGYAQGLASTSYNNAVQQAMANRAQQIGIGQAGVQAGQFAMGNGLNAAGADATNLAKAGSNIAQLYQNRGIAQQTDSAASPSTLDKIANGVGTASKLWSLGSTIGSFFSDENLKTDVQELDPHEIAASLRMMSPKSYKYSNEAQAKGAPAGTQVGIIAQDAEKGKATRNLVSKDGDGDRMVNIPKSVSFLLAAAAAQNERLDKLEGKK